jgi:hypothetical protein
VMLMMSDPFRQLDRLAQQVFGTAARPAAMPLDAWREDTGFVKGRRPLAASGGSWSSAKNANASFEAASPGQVPLPDARSPVPVTRGPRHTRP